MTDVRHFHTDNDGDIVYSQGSAEMSDGFEAAAYYSLFGGNERDDGLAATKKWTWWGNLSETVEARKYTSELQNLLTSIPAIPANLKRLEDAAERDLSWFKDELGAAITVEVSIARPNVVKIALHLEIDGSQFDSEFFANWRANRGT